jgi:hypothetical protein
VENEHPVMEKVDKILRISAARTSFGATVQAHAASVQNFGCPRRLDPTLAMAWLRLHCKGYGGQSVALDRGRLIAHEPNARDGYVAAEADSAYLPMIKYISPLAHSHSYSDFLLQTSLERLPLGVISKDDQT